MKLTEQMGRKLTEYFKTEMGLEDYRNGWLKGECEECGKLKFGINIDQDRANCFYCGPMGNLLDFVMKREGFNSSPELFNFLNVFKGMDFLKPQIEKKDYQTIQLPESFKLLTLGESEMGNMARKYMEGRGFNIDKLSVNGVGYCTSGEYSGYIVFPFYQSGKLVYFATRSFINMGQKFKNPPIEKFGIKKTSILYNIDSLAIYNKNYLVESITNAQTLGNNAIVTLGKTISNYQKSIILRSPCKDIVIGWDPDAIEGAIKLGLELVNHKRVKVLKLPDNKDINNIGKKETKKIEKNSPWLSYNDLLMMKNSYEKPEYSY